MQAHCINFNIHHKIRGTGTDSGLYIGILKQHCCPTMKRTRKIHIGKRIQQIATRASATAPIGCISSIWNGSHTLYKPYENMFECIARNTIRVSHANGVPHAKTMQHEFFPLDRSRAHITSHGAAVLWHMHDLPTVQHDHRQFS